MDQNPLGLADKASENRAREFTREYLNFLDDLTDEKTYSQKVEDLIRENGTRLIVNINDLRRKFPERANGLIRNFVEEIICLENAFKDYVSKVDADYAKTREFHVGFEGSFGDRHVNPRRLKSEFLGNMVCCEGIVTKCSLVRPKIVKSIHYCEATKKTLEKKYTDFTSYEAVQSSNVYPKEDENKNPLETEFGLCVYKDHQIFSIQELPECAPPGQLPRNVDVIADDDLADRCKPGDRVCVIGLFRVLPNKQGGASSGNFRSVLIANNVQLQSREMQPNFEQDDIKNIRKMSRHKDIFDLLARSLAPSIYGHEEVKKAILCLLLGGTERILENGTRLRGDINVLLIGDPSVAKSQMLRYVINTAPRVIATTGRGSSGVGLTAAVLHDNDTGERRLEAGAMVLADRGIVCIDEFDKMSDIDRTAIHEVMEQGRVSISKAGIQAKLNARCSVLAAANPVFGRYNSFKNPMENIGMQDSLLSRFDLIFVLLDEHDVERDKAVAENVVKLHRFRTPGESDGTVLPLGNDIECRSTFDYEVEDAKSSSVYEKNRDWTAVDESQKILSAEFVRKYIHMAKAIKPKLGEEASKFISESYSELRSTDAGRTDRERTMPVTARQLETLIRLSTAMAKARLAKEVELIDAKNAYDLLHFACFKEKPKEVMDQEARKGKRQRNAAENTAESDGDENMETDEIITSKEPRTSRYPRRGTSQTSNTADTNESVPMQSPPSKRAKSVAAISVDRYRKFKECFRQAYDNAPKENGLANLETVKGAIQQRAGRAAFTDDEIMAGFEKLEDENACMLVDDNVTVI
ncbi:MCM2/3/5 family domain-containing protein [Ditylenchus destructor]|uniref:DNA replication licensing factor MCM3 n=1 Tax=Ditylenchus destructor TaxID=166010 RepID=A0AAD4R872_9BILA|nr:MCM2/3/5 family domain-containing protein [Ditylenchus destructor]